MSFDANIGRPQPVIKAAANMNNDGGSSGNTGFMMRGQRKKEKENSKSVFDANIELDTFEMISKLPKDSDKRYGFQNSWFDNLVERFIK